MTQSIRSTSESTAPGTTRQDLTTDKVTPFAIQASGEADGVGLSASFENSTTRTDYTKAQYLSEGLWKDWNEC